MQLKSLARQKNLGKAFVFSGDFVKVQWIRFYETLQELETKLEPICPGDNRAGKDDKQYPQNHATAAAGA